MRCFIPDKNLRRLLGRYPELEVSRTRRHLRVVRPDTGDFIILSLTSSDWRSLRKVRRDLEHLRTGDGYLGRAARQRA
ncbi:hypothetical protein [Paraburkholderia adhaesiva]|uniref:hypothetical protein n=1 Tax=Paraburkholderia adhaesiva TaxID=2883244 RepID=UPI001F175EF5|nr:hypothetical protein [Paraburkholderia adhaesiva]